MIITGALAVVFTTTYFAGKKIIKPSAEMLANVKSPYVEIAPEKISDSSEMEIPRIYPIPPVPKESGLEQKVVGGNSKPKKPGVVLENPYNDSALNSINESVIKSQEMYRENETPVIQITPQKEEELKSGYEINESGEAVPVQ